RGEKISHPLEHPDLRGAALSLARVFDIQHEHAHEMLAPSPDAPDRQVNVTHLIPRSTDDLRRRRRAFELVAALSGGPWAVRPTTSTSPSPALPGARTCGAGAVMLRGLRTWWPTSDTCATAISRPRT